ncbi:unnamed protein product, partial [Meganyctiphanes norvegica]
MSDDKIEGDFSNNNIFYGSYCIADVSKLIPNPDHIRVKKAIFLPRVKYNHQRQQDSIVRHKLQSKSLPTVLLKLRLLARFSTYQTFGFNSLMLSSRPIAFNLAKCLATPSIYAMPVTICSQVENYKTNLRVIDILEWNKMFITASVQCQVKNNARINQKTLHARCQVQGNSRVSQAWAYIAPRAGGEKLQDAYYIFQELLDKNSSTAALLNGQAVCFLGQEKYEEAEAALQEALEKDPNNPDTLINLMVLAHRTAKIKNVGNLHLAQLRDEHKNHKFVQDMANKEEEFSRLVKSYAI